MSFLQPLFLFALPLIGLPILIHLVNRQRHRSVPWGAMMFLLDAKRLQKGMAKLRFWLIMAMRMLAIAGLLFAISRPLASGWFGNAVGNQAETVLVLLDRSASMWQQSNGTAKSKLRTAREKLSQLLDTVDAGTRFVLIESTRMEAEELESARDLLELPQTEGTTSATDIPGMFQSAVDYLVQHQVGQADIWLASDLRRSDWMTDDGRWGALRQSLSEREGVRIHLLSYPELSTNNLSVAVQNVRQRAIGDRTELVLDVRLIQSVSEQSATTSVPLAFVVQGTRSILNVELTGSETLIQGHVLPLDQAVQEGWGFVEIPGGDQNESDDRSFFVFAKEAERLTVILAEEESAVTPVRIAATASPDPAITSRGIVIRHDQLSALNWDEISLLVWQGPLPGETMSKQLETFLKSGRPVLFFPPREPTSQHAFLQAHWEPWVIPRAATKNDKSTATSAGSSAATSPPSHPMPEIFGVGSFKSDSDLLVQTQAGTPLPVGTLQISQYAPLVGPGNILAKISTGDPFLIRADDLPAYFCATWPQEGYSSMARQGVTLYAMVQRALEMGARARSKARAIDAGSTEARSIGTWELASELPHVVIAERSFHAAVFHRDDQWSALQRPATEDHVATVPNATVEDLFAGLDFHQIQDTLDSTSPLASEIWRFFLASMACALVLEAILCLP